jgi:hypothetical protein
MAPHPYDTWLAARLPAWEHEIDAAARAAKRRWSSVEAAAKRLGVRRETVEPPYYDEQGRLEVDGGIRPGGARVRWEADHIAGFGNMVDGGGGRG